MGRTKIAGFQPYQSVTPLPEEEIVKLCKRWKIEELYLFDTILKNEERQYYEIDVMVVFSSDAHWGWHIVSLEDELSELFGRKINIATKNGVESNPNKLSREQKLKAAKLVYVSQ